MKSWFISRSPRERILLLCAAAVAGVILLLQGVLVPGQAAARSASARNTVAAAELAEARVIAASLRTDAARGAATGSFERIQAALPARTILFPSCSATCIRANTILSRKPSLRSRTAHWRPFRNSRQNRSDQRRIPTQDHSRTLR